MGFQKPSRIQEKALPLLLANPPTNFIGQSQSGTGKTAAFVLNMLSRVDPEVKQPQAICVAPARELAMQIVDVVQKMGEYTQIEVFHAGKGTVQRGSPRLHQQIVVGTPGTIYDVRPTLSVSECPADPVITDGHSSEVARSQRDQGLCPRRSGQHARTRHSRRAVHEREEVSLAVAWSSRRC